MLINSLFWSSVRRSCMRTQQHVIILNYICSRNIRSVYARVEHADRSSMNTAHMCLCNVHTMQAIECMQAEFAAAIHTAYFLCLLICWRFKYRLVVVNKKYENEKKNRSSVYSHLFIVCTHSHSHHMRNGELC